MLQKAIFIFAVEEKRLKKQFFGAKYIFFFVNDAHFVRQHFWAYPKLVGTPCIPRTGWCGGWLHLVMYRTHPLLSGKNRSLHVDEIEHAAALLSQKSKDNHLLALLFHTCLHNSRCNKDTDKMCIWKDISSNPTCYYK